MLTRSSRSPTSSGDEQGKTLPPPGLSKTNKCSWTTDDETALIDFLLEHKAEMTDGTGFKPVIWTGAAALMANRPTVGAVRSATACKTKWGRVSAFSTHMVNLTYFKLKEAYHTVTALKGLSGLGLTWDDERGMDAEDINVAQQWKTYVQVRRPLFIFIVLYSQSIHSGPPQGIGIWQQGLETL